MISRIKTISNQYKGISLPVRAAFWLIVGNILIKGVYFISTPIFTRIMPSEEYGKVAIFYSAQSIVPILANWDGSYGAYQKGLFKYQDNEKVFTAAVQFLTSLLSILAFTVLYFVYDSISGWFTFPKKMLGLLFLYSMMQPAYMNWFACLQKEFRYMPAVASSLLFCVLTVSGSLMAVIIIAPTAEIKYGIELMISVLFFSIFYIINVFKFGSLLKNLKAVMTYCIFFVKFQAPCVIHSLTLVILNQIDRIMIGNMVGKSETAYYSVAYAVGYSIVFIVTSLENVMTPWRYRRMDEKDYKIIKGKTNYIIILLSMGVIAFMMVSPEIISVFFPKEYYDAIYSIPPIISSVFFLFLYNSFIKIETYYENTRYITCVAVGCAVFNILANGIGIKVFGYIACGYTTLFSYILLAGGHYLFMKRISRENNLAEEVYDIKAICILSGIVLLVCVGSVFLYPYAYVRYIFLSTIAIVVWVKRHNIINVIKELKGDEL